jgi:hypothetical protein
VDRQSAARPSGALAELAREFAMPCFAIATIDEIVATLAAPGSKRPLEPALLERIRDYRARYGAR